MNDSSLDYYPVIPGLHRHDVCSNMLANVIYKDKNIKKSIFNQK